MKLDKKTTVGIVGVITAALIAFVGLFTMQTIKDIPVEFANGPDTHWMFPGCDPHEVGPGEPPEPGPIEPPGDPIEPPNQ